jgi:predicted lipid-binding transport protein (Tim44 family)
MAFEKGDLAPVRAFLGPEVHDSFAEVIAAREAQGLTITAEFIGLRELALHGAEFDPATGEGEIAVRYVGELISVARDSNGAIVEGDPKSPRKQRDVWTFARKMGASDPNWHLVATGE